MSEKKELNQEQLDKVNGGVSYEEDKGVCPYCGSIEFTSEYECYGAQKCECKICGTTWLCDGNGRIYGIQTPEKYEDPKKAMENMLKLKSDLDKRLRGK